MRYPGYSAYKESGVQWLGEVPQHWEVKRLRMTTHLNDRKVEADEDNPVPYIGMESIESWTGKLLPINPNVVPSGVANRFNTKNTLFGKLRPYLAKACNPDFDGLCSTELLVIESDDFDRRALLYCLLADGFIKLVDSSTYGSKMPRANWDFIGNCLLPVPSRPEQTAIADFLDRETGRIDTLVRKKRRLIALLKERRSALISRTVTRGLPEDAAREFGLEPHTRFKDSGIEWLGEVPEGWGARRLRHISDRVTVGVVVNPSSYVSDDGMPFLLGGDVREFKIDGNNAKRCSAVDSDGPLWKSRLSAGDLVVVRVGYPGIAAVVPPTMEGANCASMMIVGKHKRFDSPWLAYLFNSQVGRDQVEIVQYGAAQKQFNISHAVNFTFPFPSLAEQTAISAYLDRETAKISQLMDKVESAIDRLQEYRTALSTAAVTGKVDVRDAAA